MLTHEIQRRVISKKKNSKNTGNGVKMKKQTEIKTKIIIIIFHQVLGKEHFSYFFNKKKLRFRFSTKRKTRN